MNCDEAFEALTEMNGRAGDDLQRHLQSCPRCREMQEVLSPALTLLELPRDSASSNDEELCESTSDNPLRQTFLTIEAVQVARETAQRLTIHNTGSEPVKTGRQLRWLAIQMAVAATTSAAVAILFAFCLLSGPSGSANRSGSAATAQVCLFKKASDVETQRVTAHSVVSSCIACHMNKTAARF